MAEESRGVQQHEPVSSGIYDHLPSINKYHSLTQAGLSMSLEIVWLYKIKHHTYTEAGATSTATISLVSIEL